METRVARCISPTFAHLSLSPAINNTRRMLLDLVHNRLLFWMEVLSLTSSIRLGAPMMSQAQTWLRVSDARNFITWFAANPCSQSTPHIYISALLSVPNQAGHTRGLANITSSQRDEARYSVTISPEGDRIASGHRDGSIHIYDAQTGAEVAGPIRAHTSPINSVAFSPNGSHIASGSYDHTVRIWDSYSGTSVSEPFNGHTGGVESVAFSPDGRRIVSGSHDHTVIVWDTLSGAILLGPLKGHTDLVMSAMFSPDGRLIASGSFDHTIRLWDANTGEPAAQPFVNSNLGRQVGCECYVPSGTSHRQWHGDTAVTVCDAVSGTVVAGPLRGHTSVIRAVMFTPDGTRAVSGSEIALSVYGTCKPRIARPNSNQARSLVGAFASFSSGGTLQVWDTLSGEVILRPSENHTAAELSAVNTVAFSPQGSHIAASGSDFTILVWDLRTGTTAPQPLKGHNKPVRCIVFSPDGSHLCSGSDDKAIIVWDINAGVPVNPPCKGHTGPVCSIAYSPDGAQVASGSDERTVRVWDPSTGSLLHTLSGHAGGVTSIAFSPSGNCIVSGGASGKLWGWNARSNSKHELPLAGFNRPFTNILDSRSEWESGKQSDPTSHPVSRVCFSPDGSCILAGSGSTIRMFDAQTMEGDAQEPQPNIIRVWRPGAHDSLSTHSRSRYWSYDSDGRILSPEGLVMWVPPDLLPLLK
ncbi:WD40-repeat-containing domain protein, partial [Rhizoctonia solani]